MNARPLPPGHVRAHTGNTPAEHMPPPATGQPSAFPRPVEQHDADCDVPGFCGCNGWSTAHARRQPAPSAGQDTERLRDENDCGHHTWDGLMTLLDEHWPADVFPTVTQDDPRRDAAARLVSFMRWTDQLIAERDEARAQVQRVRELAGEYERHAGLIRAQEESTASVDVLQRWRAFEDAAASLRRALDPT